MSTFWAVQEYLRLCVWYSVEFAANIAVIAFVLHTFGYLKFNAPKRDVPGTLETTVSQTNGLLSNLMQVAGQVKNAVDAATGPGTVQGPNAVGPGGVKIARPAGPGRLT